MENLLNKKQLLQFEFDFSDRKPYPTNPMFSYGKARILYTEHNRNGSHFSKEAVQKALPTLFGIPIVGEFDEETNNFKGHGGKVEISDDGVKFIDTTVPFGHISADSNFTWETVEHIDGTIKEYLVADKCVFWTGRYPQLNGLFEYGQYNQSMEIEVTNGEFAVIDGQETFRIDEFVFSALCILGINTPDDPNGHVEPCFEDASIGLYSKEQNFAKKFAFMLDELKNIPEPEPTGGQEMSYTSKQLFAKLGQAMKDSEFTYLDHTNELVIFSDAEGNVFESTYTISEDGLVISETKEASEFKLTDEEKAFVTAEVTALETALANAKTEFEAEKETAIKEANDAHAKALETANTELANFKKETETKLANLDALTKENEQYKAKAEKVDALEAELATLQEYKRTSELDGLMEKFSGKLEDDVLKSTIEKNADKSLEDIEALIFAEIGKQSFSMDKKEPATPKSVAVPAHSDDKKELGFYASLKAKHSSK